MISLLPSSFVGTVEKSWKNQTFDHSEVSKEIKHNLLIFPVLQKLIHICVIVYICICVIYVYDRGTQNDKLHIYDLIMMITMICQCQVIPKWYQNSTQVIPKWYQNSTKVVPNHILPNWCSSGVRWSLWGLLVAKRQGGRSWQPFGESKNGHKTFVRCVFAIFASEACNWKVANLI